MRTMPLNIVDNKAPSEVFTADFVLTNHASQRISQRGITELMIDICLDFGKLILQGDGSQVYIMTNKVLKKLKEIKKLGIRKQIIERIKGLVVIISNDGAVITAYKNKNLQKLSQYQK